MTFWKALIVTGGLVAAAALIGTKGAGGTAAVRERYQSLDKPAFAPSPRVFGPVWGVLYPVVAVAGARVLAAEPSVERTRALAAWGTQLALNAAWTPLFFGAHAERTALVDIAGVLGFAAAFVALARKVDRPAAAMTLPYLGWLGFASALNVEIVRRRGTIAVA